MNLNVLDAQGIEFRLFGFKGVFLDTEAGVQA